MLELSAQQNRIGTLSGLSQCRRLRKLNLSFNRITKVEGLSTLHALEFLELGKNQIRNCEMLVSDQNKLCALTELYLYMNFVEKLPPAISFQSLRVLNVNRN